MAEKQKEDALYNLRGKTLKVYLHLLSRNEPVGVREVQRILGFSSPSVAFHHIEKLLNMGLVEKDNYGRYRIVKSVDVAILQPFTKVGKFMLPRLSFYAAFFTTLTALYVIQNLNALDLYALMFGSAATLAFWYEALRTWLKKPF
ncbi:MAG: helix-turn-helix domain-containing protein [Nitrososphaerales archaeon]